MVPADAMVDMGDGTFRPISDLITAARNKPDDSEWEQFQNVRKIVSGEADPDTIMRVFGTKKEPAPVDPAQVVSDLRREVDALKAELGTVKPTYEQISGLRAESETKFLVEKNADKLPHLAVAIKNHPEGAATAVNAINAAFKMYEQHTGKARNQVDQETAQKITAHALMDVERKMGSWASALGGGVRPPQAANVQVNDNQPVNRQQGFSDGSSLKVTSNGIVDAQGRSYRQLPNGQFQMISSEIPGTNVSGAMLSPDAGTGVAPGQKFGVDQLKQMIRNRADGMAVNQ